MSNRESLKTWAAVAVVLIFAGLASALVPFLLDQAQTDSAATESVARGPLETTIDVSQLPFVGEVLVEIPFIADNVQGQPITALQAAGIAFGVVLFSIGGMGLLITGAVFLYSRLLNGVYTDERYQTAAVSLQEREQSRVGDLRKDRPVTPETDPQVRSRWSMGVFGFIFLLLVLIVGLVLSTVYFADTGFDILGLSISGAAALNLVLALLTIVILVLWLRRRDPEDFENPASDNNPVNWGYVWVVVSGLLVVGLGAGAALLIVELGKEAIAGG